MLKIVQKVATCKECPHRRYGSAGRYDCTKADYAPLIESEVIPAWCPLPDDATPIAARAFRAVEDAREVLSVAIKESVAASPERLIELIVLASAQLARS